VRYDPAHIPTPEPSRARAIDHAERDAYHFLMRSWSTTKFAAIGFQRIPPRDHSIFKWNPNASSSLKNQIAKCGALIFAAQRLKN
jgi:hypothetical protein